MGGPLRVGERAVRDEHPAGVPACDNQCPIHGELHEDIHKVLHEAAPRKVTVADARDVDIARGAGRIIQQDET